MVKMLEDNTKDSTEKSFSIEYINKNEAMFLLGLLKSIPCSHCPDFYNDCRGGATLQETALLSESDYIDRHIPGTEKQICGKLRNIVALSKAEEQELDNKFELDFNKRISLLTKKGDDDKFVLIHDKDEFNSIMETMQMQLVERIQKDVDKINKHNASVVLEMQEKLAFQDQTIQAMQIMIEKLKRKKIK